MKCFSFAGPIRLALLGACMLTVLCALVPALSSAAQVTLAWDPDTDPDLAGYKLYYGFASRSYQFSVDVGNVTSYTLSGLLEGQIYYFAATAYNSSLNESGFSNEVSKAIADVTPPTVSMTVPAASATVAGTVTVSASATDNVGVVGEQFKLETSSSALKSPRCRVRFPGPPPRLSMGRTPSRRWPGVRPVTPPLSASRSTRSRPRFP